MKILLGFFLLTAMTLSGASIHDYTLPSITGEATPLKNFEGKVVLIVNVASKCGFTPQYDGLQKLYEKYQDRGLVILGFPANNFGAQEPGTNEEIQQFCRRTYGVSFPMFAKVSVKGDDKTPLYQFLTDPARNPNAGGEIRWNFTKFLAGKDGTVIARFEPKVTPDSPELAAAIEKALAE